MLLLSPSTLLGHKLYDFPDGWLRAPVIKYMWPEATNYLSCFYQTADVVTKVDNIDNYFQ